MQNFTRTVLEYQPLEVCSYCFSGISMHPQSDDSSASILAAVQQLVNVVAQLRSPTEGCPWDLAQTPQTLTPYVIEEAYEVVDAIQSGDQGAIVEELGDLLLQVVLQAQIASEQADFSLQHVAEAITQKLIRRHPHVFGTVQVGSVDEVRQNWEQIKASEKGETVADAQRLVPKLSRYARTLPPLMAATKISHKAAIAGFDWDDIEGVWAKFQEELAEFREAIDHEDQAHQETELGDLLMTVVQLARWYHLDPSAALQGSQKKFIRRLAEVEAISDRPISSYTSDELGALWQQAKKNLG